MTTNENGARPRGATKGDDPMGEPMMTLAQVAELLAVDEVTVRREVRRGRLAVARVGKQLRFDPAEVAAYLRRHREGAAA